MMRARRADAKTALEQFRASQEMLRAERGSYSTDLVQLVNSWGVSATAGGHYGLIFIVATANSFTVEAQPTTARQTPDGSLFISQPGSKMDGTDGNVYPSREMGQVDFLRSDR